MCLEVGPQLAHDTAGTIKEAVELHRRGDRKNLMIKVPATAAGIPAIEQLIGYGICRQVHLDVRAGDLRRGCRCLPARA